MSLRAKTNPRDWPLSQWAMLLFCLAVLGILIYVSACGPSKEDREKSMAQGLHDCIWDRRAPVPSGMHNETDQIACLVGIDDPRAENYVGYLAEKQGKWWWAAEKFRDAAGRGNPYAQFNLGMLYHFGKGEPHDDTQAMQWFQKAAAQGLPRAENMIGIAYQNGFGVSKDEAAAEGGYRKAALRGDVWAQSNLGYLLHFGYPGKPPNNTEALIWLRKAGVAAGFEPANVLLCDLYKLGVWVPQDLKVPSLGDLTCTEAERYEEAGGNMNDVLVPYDDTEGIQ